MSTSVTQAILGYTLDELQHCALQDISTRLPIEFIATLSHMVVPCASQLQPSLAILHGKDSIVTVGTGSEKALFQLIPLLLRPDTLSITISPLKRLQATQSPGTRVRKVSSERLRSTEIPIQEGHYQHLIVSLEQLLAGMYDDHLPRLARLVRQDHAFTKRIRRVHIDEAHNIYTAGLLHHGEEALHPAYSRLIEFRIILPVGIPFQALSATLPPYIYRVVQRELSMYSDHVSIRLSTNRPNITYATTPIIGTLHDFRNFNCLIPTNFHPPMDVPKTLILHDSRQDAADAARYTDLRLPKELQNQGIVKHYHSDMSTEYLKQTYENFSNPNGRCRILHATAEASMGLDIQDVRIVIQYGVCKNLAELMQRTGHAVRDPTMSGLFVVMYEPWVLDIELATHQLDSEDPDRPHAGGTIGKNASKQDRTGCAMIQLIQSTTCLREFFGNYLDDHSPSARQYSTLYCCDRHAYSDFELSAFLLGDIYTGQLDDEIPTATEYEQIQYRAEEDRLDLFDTLWAWRNEAHAHDPIYCVRPVTWIIDDEEIGLLSKIHPSDIDSVEDITKLLQETSEWEDEFGQRLFDTIKEFDRVVESRKHPVLHV